MSLARTAIALAAVILAVVAALAADPPAPPVAEAVPALAAHPAHPVHHSACLSKPEQRAAVASHQAISLAQAIRSLRAHGRRSEVVRARLCRRGDRLVYLLTLLGRSGKVRRVHVDAVSGDVSVGR